MDGESLPWIAHQRWLVLGLGRTEGCPWQAPGTARTGSGLPSMQRNTLVSLFTVLKEKKTKTGKNHKAIVSLVRGTVHCGH